MNPRILITGSRGLIGASLAVGLSVAGYDVVKLDLRGLGAEHGDVRRREQVEAAIAGCQGVVHLAAVSRVAVAERDPDLCRATNLGGLRNLVDVAAAQAPPPWVLFASSREVYGERQRHEPPVSEDAPLRPINVYGRTKVEGEELVIAAGARGVRSAVVRLSNVYGGVDDHDDRVVPSFVRAALTATTLRVEGADRGFDFTHLDDVRRGLTLIVARLCAGATSVPTLHLVTGRATTLGDLARQVVVAAGVRPTSRIVEVAGRTFDVSGFVGDPRRAEAVLDWRSTVPIAAGVAGYLASMRRRLAAETP